MTPLEISDEGLHEAFEYLLGKLTKQSKTENPTCCLRIFYKVGCTPGPNTIQRVVNKFTSKNLVITIVPTTHLHNSNTFLSVCGIRHE